MANVPTQPSEIRVLRPNKPSGVGVLFIQSGVWRSGNAFASSVASNAKNFEPFLKRGQTVFVVSHPDKTMPEVLSDVRRSVVRIQASARSYGVNPKNLMVMGMSAGGHIANMLGTTSKAFRSVSAFYPPSDFSSYGGNPAQTHPFMGTALKALLPNDTPQTMRAFSPLTHVTAKTPPTLLFHGTVDSIVPYEQSTRYAEVLTRSHVENQLVTRRGYNHAWPDYKADFERTAAWFDKHREGQRQ